MPLIRVKDQVTGLRQELAAVEHLSTCTPAQRPMPSSPDTMVHRGLFLRACSELFEREMQRRLDQSTDFERPVGEAAFLEPHVFLVAGLRVLGGWRVAVDAEIRRDRRIGEIANRREMVKEDSADVDDRR